MAPRRVADTYGGYRARLVEELREQGISDMAVLAAVGQVPRHLFVPEALRNQAYNDTSLPIGNGQTISQPSTHARYLQALGLTGAERVLEIGTGSGYQTALLSFLAEHVGWPCLLITSCLQVKQGGVLTICLQQLLVATLLRDFCFLQNDYVVSHADGRKSVRDNY